MTPAGEAPSGAKRLGAEYWKVWTASVVSNLGDGTSVVAYPWLASVLTRDPALVAGLTVAMRLPWLVFSLPAGALVDRGDRRRIMVSTSWARAALSLVLAASVASGTANLPLLYAVVKAAGAG